MPSRRNRFEIWSEILEGCLRTCRTQNWLIRKVGVKTGVMKEALETLESSGLIEKIENPEAGLNYEFITTSKGEQALLQYYTLITEYFTLDQKEQYDQKLGLIRFFIKKSK